MGAKGGTGCQEAFPTQPYKTDSVTDPISQVKIETQRGGELVRAGTGRKK
jgi:hypothetical protein